MLPKLPSPLTLQLYRRILTSLRSLESIPPEGIHGQNEVQSRVNYYRSWAAENILDATELSGKSLVEAVKRGEESRVWVLKKYGCSDDLDPFDWDRFDNVGAPKKP